MVLLGQQDSGGVWEKRAFVVLKVYLESLVQMGLSEAREIQVSYIGVYSFDLELQDYSQWNL